MIKSLYFLRKKNNCFSNNEVISTVSTLKLKFYTMKKIVFGFLSVVLLVPFSTEAQKKMSINAKQLFGDIRARQIGPAVMSGRINDLELHPTNNRIIYVELLVEECGNPMMDL